MRGRRAAIERGGHNALTRASPNRQSLFPWTTANFPSQANKQCFYAVLAQRTSASQDRRPAQKLGKRRSGQRVGGNRNQEGEHRLALADVDVLRLLDEANVPAKRCPVVLLEVPVREKEGQLEGFCEAHELELCGGR